MCERGALGARWSGRVGPRVLRCLLRQRCDRRIPGADVENNFHERRHWRGGSRRSNYAADTAADARTIVVVVPRLGVVRRSMMMRHRHSRRGRCGNPAVSRADVYDARLPHNEGEPDRENGRNRAEPALSAHRHQNASVTQTVPVPAKNRRSSAGSRRLHLAELRSR